MGTSSGSGATDTGAAPARASRIGRVPLAGLYGIASQVLNAGTNVATSYAASLLLFPGDFGRFVVAFGAVTVVLGAGRGLIGSTMLVHLPSLERAEGDRLVGAATGFTVVVGVAVSGLVALVGLWFPVLWWFAPWLAVALLHDLGRYVYLATGRTGRALSLDVVWAAVQVAVVVVGHHAGGGVTLGLLAAGWGAGATAGVVLFVVVTRPRVARPARWLSATRDVAGWFTATAVISQVELYLVLLLAGVLLGPTDVGGLRALQLMTYQPALVLLGSMMTVLQPSVVRAAGVTGELRRAWSRVDVAVVPVVAVLAVVVVARTPLVETFFAQYVDFAHLAIPLVLQSAIVAAGIAPLAVLNGLRQGRSAFLTQACRLVAVTVGVVLGVAMAGLEGLAWALVVSSLLTWLRLRVVALRALRAREAELGATADEVAATGTAEVRTS